MVITFCERTNWRLYHRFGTQGTSVVYKSAPSCPPVVKSIGAFVPVDGSISNWKSFLTALQKTIWWSFVRKLRANHNEIAKSFVPTGNPTELVVTTYWLEAVNKYEFDGLPRRSVANCAPYTRALFPFPLSSFAFPLNG